MRCGGIRDNSSRALTAKVAPPRALPPRQPHSFPFALAPKSTQALPTGAPVAAPAAARPDDHLPGPAAPGPPLSDRRPRGRPCGHGLVEKEERPPGVGEAGHSPSPRHGEPHGARKLPRHGQPSILSSGSVFIGRQDGGRWWRSREAGGVGRLVRGEDHGADLRFVGRLSCCHMALSPCLSESARPCGRPRHQHGRASTPRDAGRTLLNVR